MRLISIWLVAIGFTTLVACGGAEVTVGDGADKAEEADKGGDDEAAEEEEAEEEEAAEDDAPAEPELICCEAKNKKGVLMKKRTRKGACDKMQGKIIADDQCPAE